jgi:peptide deformylase
MILPLIKYGSPLLRKNSFDIDAGEDFAQLAANMSHTLKNAEGIGLAGPQVGMLKNIFIIDTTPVKDAESVERVFFNPIIIHYGEVVVYYTEGCLSIPGINEEILRPDKIEVRYRNENFDWQEEVLNGLIARIFQHEFDHLQGILFIDKLNPLKKKLIRNRLREIKKGKY